MCSFSGADEFMRCVMDYFEFIGKCCCCFILVGLCVLVVVIILGLALSLHDMRIEEKERRKRMGK